MKTQHTPGPWCAEGCTVYAGENRVAQTWSETHDGLPTPAMVADARLIAAAPELQAALDGILQWWMESDGGDDMPVNLFYRAEAALKVAKGGTK